MTAPQGWVVLNRARGSQDPWAADHSGHLWSRSDALTEARGCTAEMPGDEWAVARVVIDGPAWVVRPDAGYADQWLPGASS